MLQIWKYPYGEIKGQTKREIFSNFDSLFNSQRQQSLTENKNQLNNSLQINDAIPYIPLHQPDSSSPNVDSCDLQIGI